MHLAAMQLPEQLLLLAALPALLLLLLLLPTSLLLLLLLDAESKPLKDCYVHMMNHHMRVLGA
jgi:hypothetical protein